MMQLLSLHQVHIDHCSTLGIRRTEFESIEPIIAHELVGFPVEILSPELAELLCFQRNCLVRVNNDGFLNLFSTPPMNRYSAL